MRFEIDNDFILMRKPFSNVNIKEITFFIEILRGIPRWILGLYLRKLGSGKRQAPSRGSCQRIS
jgi:hypothetical protein